MNNFSERLKNVLAAKGMTQEELAELSQTTGATISRYVNEERTPNAALLLKIATALNVSTDYLLGKDSTGLAPPDAPPPPLTEQDKIIARIAEKLKKMPIERVKKWDAFLDDE